MGETDCGLANACAAFRMAMEAYKDGPGAESRGCGGHSRRAEALARRGQGQLVFPRGLWDPGEGCSTGWCEPVDAGAYDALP